MSSPTIHLPCSRLVGHASEDGSSRPSPSSAPCHDRAMAAEGTRRGSLPTRRELLRTAALATVVAPLLVACDIRLEDDAPTLPLLQRKSVPDEAVLVDLVRRTTALAQAAGRVPNPNDAVKHARHLHRTQADVLRSRLTSAGVPNHVIDGTTTTTTTTPGTGPHGRGQRTAVDDPAGRRDRGDRPRGRGAPDALPTVTAANRAVVASVVAACGAAVEILGATVPGPRPTRCHPRRRCRCSRAPAPPPTRSRSWPPRPEANQRAVADADAYRPHHPRDRAGRRWPARPPRWSRSATPSPTR